MHGRATIGREREFTRLDPRGQAGLRALGPSPGAGGHPAMGLGGAPGKAPYTGIGSRPGRVHRSRGSTGGPPLVRTGPPARGSGPGLEPERTRKSHGCGLRAIADRRTDIPRVPPCLASRLVCEPGVPPRRAPRLVGRRADHRGRACRAVPLRAGLPREVLCGPETVLPEPGLLFHCRLRNERSTHLTPGGLIEYQSCMDVERVDLEIFRHLCEEMTLDPSRTGLFHRFRSANRLAPPPISHLHVDAGPPAVDPRVPRLPRRVRDRPHPVAVRAESVAGAAIGRRRPAGLPARGVTPPSRVESTFRSDPHGWTMSKTAGPGFAPPALAIGGPPRRYNVRRPGRTLPAPLA